ncbi:MAG: class I SAM-dependent DNA methyltransferase [Planctomycetota bacterium]|nr:class I SAM-dependent DNA methyltransferase [Planctomycetota bacterium]
MPLSWNEIRQRAITFSRNWSDASRERAEAQTFWNEFFDIFGIRRRTVATFEEPVRNLAGDTEFIDLFWKGRLIAEHKSRGRDLSKAHTQAINYIQNLHNENRRDDIPRYILVSDFARFALHDLEPDSPEHETLAFDLKDLPKNIRNFAFIAGYETRRLDPEDPANEDATRRLANLHDRLEDQGYTNHHLQRFMVRILFCLFADDTGIFEPDAFKSFIQNQTRPDGSDLGVQLARFFQVLNSPSDHRQRNLDEDLAALPYVNGDLFAENLPFPEFNYAMRTALLSCCAFQWQKISPAVFGSLFQSIMLPRERRQIGAHYTSERDILKLTRSLFLDDLRAEFDSIRHNKTKLLDLHKRLAALKFLDPACGCGNFLVISYRELRRLEMDILQARFGPDLAEGDIRAECRLNVSQFYGIEIEEWPVRIAEVGMWLMDHQMNCELFERFGQIKPTTPLQRSPHILQANALRTDWNTVRAAFVSTNSITQGEQVGVLWTELFRKHGTKIHFVHRTFPWQSEARGKAHVHVVVLGFGAEDTQGKRIYDYDKGPEDVHVAEARNISPYLIEGGDLTVVSRSRPLCDVPEIVFGSMPNDGGHLLLDDAERANLLAQEPDAVQWLRRFVGSQEFINGESRWCLWLVDVNPARLRGMPAVMRRIEAVRTHRKASSRPTTRQLASVPSLFGEIRQPATRYLLIPSVSSETRRYIPMGFIRPDVIASNLTLMVPGATLYHFGVLSCAMHMAWVRKVCGRLKSDYRYSNKLVYNNYPWPQDVADKQKQRVEEAAQAVLDMRVECGDGRAGFLPAARSPGKACSLADLYDPLAMPAKLAKAHGDLDRAVDLAYRSHPFTSERQRVEFLFALYENLTAPLTAQPKPRRRPQRPLGNR